MQAAKVDFAILGQEETCTGDPARRAGNEYLFAQLAEQNAGTLNGYKEQGGIRQIVTTCPHCFNTLKNDYPQFGGNYEVMHHTQYIRDLIEAKRLVIDKSKASQGAITYHDSCYLGRYNEEYEAPRATLSDIPGLTVLEVKRSADKGLCCGAGGGRMFMEETAGTYINIERTNELLATGAQTIAVTDPPAPPDEPERPRLSGRPFPFEPFFSDGRGAEEHADTFRRDLYKDLKAQFVLANPPFNDSDWFRKDDDVRWQFGVPPIGNAGLELRR